MPKRLGQHFIKSTAPLSAMIETAGLSKELAVIEVGPGHGELTVPLAKACAEKGCNVISIERDAKLAAGLKSRLDDLGIKNVEIVVGDALEFFKEQKLSGRSFVVVGNIPYYITGHLLRVLGESDPRPERAVLMIQREVGDRLSSKPPQMNRLAASVQFWAEPKMITAVPRGSFSPPPAVDSAVMLLQGKDPAKTANAQKFFEAVKAVFAQPRKKLANNIMSGTQNGRKTVEDGLVGLGISPDIRPQDLSIEDIEKIAGKFF